MYLFNLQTNEKFNYRQKVSTLSLNVGKYRPLQLKKRICSVLCQELKFWQQYTLPPVRHFTERKLFHKGSHLMFTHPEELGR